MVVSWSRVNHKTEETIMDFLLVFKCWMLNLLVICMFLVCLVVLTYFQ